nr:hypothetical protein GCM10025732_50270 [Glycomyces mayteni]
MVYMPSAASGATGRSTSPKPVATVWVPAPSATGGSSGSSGTTASWHCSLTWASRSAASSGAAGASVVQEAAIISPAAPARIAAALGRRVVRGVKTGSSLFR